MKRHLLVSGLLAPFLFAAPVGAAPGADPPASTRAETSTLLLEGIGRRSSTGACREPSYVLENRTSRALSVDLLALHSLAGSDRRRHAIGAPRRLTLAPGERREVWIAYRGDPLIVSDGLPSWRFRLTVRAGGRRVSAIASCAYVCRLPRRR